MQQHSEEPLPATLAFVMVMAGLIAVGWIAMFVLLRVRW